MTAQTFPSIDVSSFSIDYYKNYPWKFVVHDSFKSLLDILHKPDPSCAIEEVYSNRIIMKLNVEKGQKIWQDIFKIISRAQVICDQDFDNQLEKYKTMVCKKHYAHDECQQEDVGNNEDKILSLMFKDLNEFIDTCFQWVYSLDQLFEAFSEQLRGHSIDYARCSAETLGMDVFNDFIVEFRDADQEIMSAEIWFKSWVKNIERCNTSYSEWWYDTMRNTYDAVSRAFRRFLHFSRVFCDAMKCYFTHNGIVHVFIRDHGGFEDGLGHSPVQRDSLFDTPNSNFSYLGGGDNGQDGNLGFGNPMVVRRASNASSISHLDLDEFNAALTIEA
ncbi:hypothetical protein H4219_002839 [Mycoemilia scoparia]|uniref:Uncharacterized protein n=1 Tax=Mycoemilia scoparia TaxID=417184 RepID=A0A9W8A097_9FUNG|nr:hypothetical protein H4219_002839 [Mycoemilia scoparia]